VVLNIQTSASCSTSGTLLEGDSLVMEFFDAHVDSARKLLDLAVQIADRMAAEHAAGFTRSQAR
jgi:hypothetical protein